MENKVKEIKKSIRNLRSSIQKQDVENNTHTDITKEFKELSKQVLELENMMVQDKLFADKSITRVVRRHDTKAKQGVVNYPSDWIGKMIKSVEVRK